MDTKPLEHLPHDLVGALDEDLNGPPLVCSHMIQEPFPRRLQNGEIDTARGLSVTGLAGGCGSAATPAHLENGETDTARGLSLDWLAGVVQQPLPRA